MTKVVDTPTPSGFEQEGQKLFERFANQYVDELYSDTLGNVVAHKKNPGKKKLMITAHIDEVGFMVKYIDENGMLYVVPIGGIDLMLLPGTRLAVHHGENSFLGVVGRKPIHLLNEKERVSFSIEDTWLDLGFKSREHALQSVSVGDPVTFSTECVQMSDDFITTRSADNKIGSMIMLELMLELHGCATDYDIYYVSTVQEEIGLRGAMPAAVQIQPDIAIVVDATHATDYPNVNQKLCGDVRLGSGPSLCVSPDTDRSLIEQLMEAADKSGIPYQMEGHPNASGTEARAIQLQCKGIQTAIVSYPVRYMHSPSEVVSISDIKNCVALLKAFLV
ncbi:MAG: M20/M25/M40 family metallo-hydrolase [Bacteroidales bacterium]|nr:M20/M25/M40 family metallo-hydrolase [Bacteroidales bacterium]